MKVEFFPSIFSEKINQLASDHTREELYYQVMQALEGGNPLEVLESALAYHQEGNCFIRQNLPALFQRDERACMLLGKTKMRMVDSDQYFKIDLLSRLFHSPQHSQEKSPYLQGFQDSQNLTFFLNWVYYLSQKGDPTGLDLFFSLEEDFLNFSQRLQWLKNLAFYFLFYRPTSFPFFWEDVLFCPSLSQLQTKRPIFSPGGGASLVVEKLFDFLRKIFHKNALLAMVDRMGEVLWLAGKLELQEELLPSCSRWLKERGLANKLDHWLALVSTDQIPTPKDLQKALDQCDSFAHKGASLSLLLPLLHNFAPHSSCRALLADKVEQIFPLEDRIEALVGLALYDDSFYQRGWEILGELRDPFRRLKGMISLMHFPNLEDCSSSQQIFSILKNSRSLERKIFWRTLSLIPSAQGFLGNNQQAILASIKPISSSLDKALLCFSLAEPFSESTLFSKRALELVENLRGANKIYGRFLRAIWLEKRGEEGALEEILSLVDAVPVVNQRKVLLQNLLPYSLNSPFFETLSKKLICFYLEERLQTPLFGFPKVTSCLSFKSVIARGWPYAQTFFEKSFALAAEEGEGEPSAEAQMSVIWDLAEIAEATGTVDPWTKGLVLSGKISNPYYQRACLVRLLYLPAYAIAIDGNKITRVIREMGKIRDDLERHSAFCEACQWVYSKGHLISDKTTLLNVLKRLARSFRSPSQLSEARGCLALVFMGWKRHREATEFFSRAMEAALASPNEYQKFQALDGLSASLAQAGELEDKGEFIHDMMMASDEMLDYKSEVYSLISCILESWGREERAQTALEKSLALCKNIPDEMKKFSSFRYICNQIQKNPQINQSPGLVPLELLARGFSNPLLNSEGCAYLGGAYLSAGNSQKGSEFFTEALEKLSSGDSSLQHQKILSLLLDKLLEGGAFESEKGIFDQITQGAKKITYPLFRDKIYCKIVEIALKSSLEDYGKEIIPLIQNRQEKDKTLMACAIHYQYRDPHQGLAFAEKIVSPPIQQAVIQKLAKNLSLFKNPLQAQKIFALALKSKRTTDTVLASYIKSIGSPTQMVSVLELF